MAQGRFTSRTIAIDPKLALLSETAELLYLKTIPHLDRDGLCIGEPYGLLGTISPLRFSQLQGKIAGCIDEWVARELVMRYPSPIGFVLFFTGFAKQQKLHYEREAPSQYPPPPGYLRTAKGLMRATDVPWTAESGVLAKNPDLTPEMIESGLQAEVQEQAEAEDQVQEQQQQQGDPAAPDSPAAAVLEEKEVRLELEAYGIAGKVVNELAGCPIDHVRGWIEYAGTQERLRNPKGYVIARLRSGEPPPEVGPPTDSEDDSYEALRRKYVPDGWENIIEH